MLWTHLGGGPSAWGGRCNERLFPLVSMLSTYATARHRPPSWTTKLKWTKKIQIHTLKYENALGKKPNVSARLNKFKSADSDDASLSSSTSCSEITQIPSVLDFPTLLLQIQDLIVLKSTFLANIFLFYPHFFDFPAPLQHRSTQ